MHAFFCNILEYCFNFFNTHMVPQKIREPFFFLKSKVKKIKNILMYATSNFYLILKFHKNPTHGNGENSQNPIRKIRNLVLVYMFKQGRIPINRSES